jgi:tRNA-splicing ligase RtcB
MNIAGEYAYAGRDWVVNRVLRLLGARDELRVHNHHNFAWWEEHDGQKWLVVRKGATPAFPGQFGFVGGSMGDDAVIIRGKESAASQRALYSTVHGAGRVMGRMEAKGKWKGAHCVKPGRVNWRQWQDTLRTQGVELRGGGPTKRPNATSAYQRCSRITATRSTFLHTLKPIGVAMAGRDTFDPYKD